MVYDVLNEPWIPVVTPAGEIRNVGIREALSEAEDLSAIRGENPLVTYGIQRLLIAILQDALRPEDKYTLFDIISAGQFDQEKLEEYYSTCREEGECFDLMDENRPFLQTAFPVEEQIGPAPITALFHQWPSGNNHVFFNHQMESEMSATPDECLRALSTLSAFQLSYGRSKHCSINGTPPKYFLYAGHNLFETLACSMVSNSQIGNLSYDSPPPVWRDKTLVHDKQVPASVSLLHGLTARPLRVQLCQVEDGAIKKVKLAYGYIYKDVRNWIDPHVAFNNSRNGERLPLLSREGRAVWRDMGTILRRDCRPMILQHAEEMLECLPGNRTKMDSRVFSLLSVQKTAMLMPVAWEEEDLTLHKSLLSEPEQIDFLQNCLECMEKINFLLRTVMGKSTEQLQDKGSGKRDAKGAYRFLTAQVQTAFLSEVRQYLIGVFVPFVEAQAAQQKDWDIACREEWGRQIHLYSIDAYQQTLSRMAQTAALLKWRALAGNLLNVSVTNTLKKGGYIKND